MTTIPRSVYRNVRNVRRNLRRSLREINPSKILVKTSLALRMETL